MLVPNFGLQAHFEVISSEMSYIRSLKILIKHFMDAPELSPELPSEHRVISRDGYKQLFSNLRAIYDVSLKLVPTLLTNNFQSCCLCHARVLFL